MASLASQRGYIGLLKASAHRTAEPSSGQGADTFKSKSAANSTHGDGAPGQEQASRPAFARRRRCQFDFGASLCFAARPFFDGCLDTSWAHIRVILHGARGYLTGSTWMLAGARAVLEVTHVFEPSCGLKCGARSAAEGGETQCQRKAMDERGDLSSAETAKSPFFLAVKQGTAARVEVAGW